MKDKRIFLQVQKGALVPVDASALEALRALNLKTGAMVSVEVKKLRSGPFNRLAHHLGALVSSNVEKFSNLAPHDVIKRLQVESGVCCDVSALNVPGVGECMVTIPRSMSYSSMCEDEFKDCIKKICRHVSEVYWPTLTPEKIQEMAERFVNE